MADRYHTSCDHLAKTNGKTNVERIVERFYNDRPFLIKEQLYDIDLPLKKMRKLKFPEEYKEGSIERNLLESYANKPIGEISRFNKGRMFYDREYNSLRKVTQKEKTSICIHFPAGWDSGVSFSANEYMIGQDGNRIEIGAVNYYVHRDGTILEYGEPELWDHHSNCGSYNRNVIAIEIVGWGPLKPNTSGTHLMLDRTDAIVTYCELNKTLEGHGKAYIDIKNNPYDPKKTYEKDDFRGNRYFTAWTTDQMESVKKLLKALCSSYDIPYRFLPLEDRYNYKNDFTSLSTTTQALTHNWGDGKAGIFSHINSASYGKWDIGPAFDWNYLENTLQTAYPYQSPASAQKEPNPLHWFDNPEIRSRGGYFPIGSNGAAHAGMHLFTPSRSSQAVSAMADGSVVAFRFYSDNQRREQEENRPEELRNLANPTHSGFVLLKHDFSLTGKEEDNVKSFYSLYMDLQPPSVGSTIPWVERLKELAKGCSLSLDHSTLGELVEQGTNGAHSRPPMDVLASLNFEGSVPVHSSNEHGVISFSEPWLTVAGKEIIGYTKSLGQEDNYCHWEVFATEKDVITGLAELLGEQRDGGTFAFEELDEAEDGLFSADELNSLLDPDEKRFGRSYLNLGPLHFKENGNETSLEEHLKSRFSKSNPMSYDLTLKLDVSPSYTLKQDMEFQFQAYNSAGAVMKTEAKTVSDLIAGTPMEVNSEAHRLRVFPPANQGFEGNLSFSPGPSFPLFEEAARHGGLLRDSLLSMPSPWSESSLEKLIDSLKKFIFINPSYAFAVADLAVINLFTEKQEEAVFDPVFGSGALIDPSQPIHAVHPALFLWLLRMNQESLSNRNDSMIDSVNPLKQYGFSLPGNGDSPRLGDKVRLLVLAEHNRPGIPDENDETGISMLKVGENSHVAVTLDRRGIFTGEYSLDYWGTYRNSDLSPIPGLMASFTVPAPSWSSAELTDDHRLRIGGLSNAPSPAPFICPLEIQFGTSPLQSVNFTHYLLIGANVLPPANTMECEINPSNPESFTDILVSALEGAHGSNLYPEGATWNDYLDMTLRMYNGGASFLFTSEGDPIEPEQFTKGYYLSEEDMANAPDDFIGNDPLNGSLRLPQVSIEQGSTVKNGVSFRQKEDDRENLKRIGSLAKDDPLTLFLNPLTGERIAKSWTYDSNRGPEDFYLARSSSGELGWVYCPNIN